MEAESTEDSPLLLFSKTYQNLHRRPGKKRSSGPDNPTMSCKSSRYDLSVPFKTRTVEVKNISHRAWDDEIPKFLSFLGEIVVIDRRCDDKGWVLNGYVTFTDPIGAAISVLLSGATLGDQPVTIDLAPDYELPDFLSPEKPIMYTESESESEAEAEVRARARAEIRDQDLISYGADPSAVRSARNAEEIVSLMLAAGFILGEDAISKAKAFDEKYQLTSTASATKQD